MRRPNVRCGTASRGWTRIRYRCRTALPVIVFELLVVQLGLIATGPGTTRPPRAASPRRRTRQAQAPGPAHRTLSRGPATPPRSASFAWAIGGSAPPVLRWPAVRMVESEKPASVRSYGSSMRGCPLGLRSQVAQRREDAQLNAACALVQDTQSRERTLFVRPSWRLANDNAGARQLLDLVEQRSVAHPGRTADGNRRAPIL